MIKTDISVPYNYSSSDIVMAVREKLPISEDEIKNVEIIKKTLNIEDKKNFTYKLTLALSFEPEREMGLLKMRKKVSPYEEMKLEIPSSYLNSRPVVVGSGPAGIFAALTLAKAGARPIILERGDDVDKRRDKIKLFEKTGILDTESNVQFGEGGAGTYSDGKLKVGAVDKYKKEVLREFVIAGADEDILYTVGAHLGTDKLHGIVKKLRGKLTSLGAEIIFGARFSSFSHKNGNLTSVSYEKDGKIQEIETENVVIAIGHSANDTFGMLYTKGLPMIPKGFGVGMRIEHKREHINSIVYGASAPASLGAASYHLVSHLPKGRSVYSFCMCPGGTVVAAASEREGIVTNGMSEYSRDAENSNAAILVSVTPSDFGDSSPLAGLEYRRKIENAAFLAAGGEYRAPAVSLDEFLFGKKQNESLLVTPSYPRGVSSVSPEKYFPEYITDSLKLAFSDYDAWLPGFMHSSAILTGPETRTTSPIRILRDENYEACGFGGIYPAGEGAGYAGGIVSSATDGIRAALAILNKYNHN